jgi:hypothetical protein
MILITKFGFELCIVDIKIFKRIMLFALIASNMISCSKAIVLSTHKLILSIAQTLIEESWSKILRSLYLSRPKIVQFLNCETLENNGGLVKNH